MTARGRRDWRRRDGRPDARRRCSDLGPFAAPAARSRPDYGFTPTVTDRGMITPPCFMASACSAFEAKACMAARLSKRVMTTTAFGSPGSTKTSAPVTPPLRRRAARAQLHGLRRRTSQARGGGGPPPALNRRRPPWPERPGMRWPAAGAWIGRHRTRGIRLRREQRRRPRSGHLDRRKQVPARDPWRPEVPQSCSGVVAIRSGGDDEDGNCRPVAAPVDR